MDNTKKLIVVLSPVNVGSEPSNENCFECEKPATKMHCIIPDGKYSIPICDNCSRKLDGTYVEMLSKSEMIKLGVAETNKKLGRRRKLIFEQVAELRAQGMYFKDIGARLGVSTSTANRYFNKFHKDNRCQ